MLIRLVNLDGTFVETTPFQKIVMVKFTALGGKVRLEKTDDEIKELLAGKDEVEIILP